MTRDDPDATLTAPNAALRTAAAAAAGGLFDGRPFLKVVGGPLLGRRIFLEFGETTLGRGEAAGIGLPDPNVSREHAAVVFDGRAFRLVDRESRNGTLLNGRPVAEGELAFGDRIRIGTSEMEFTCEGFELVASSPDQAEQAYRRTLERRDTFVAALAGLRTALAIRSGRGEEVAALDGQLARLRG
ncbi:FHA domain-containing protein [Azospirillum halopraeferens]|uniref:FHA domain-containing protein n=1 Tax=Azospirillum halopraeferens TaxID=34010 RepID=UPI0003FBEFA7|nr:FHA domain-containing protein [Azospirillum halopraeferens]